jgi:hypothetical protein
MTTNKILKGLLVLFVIITVVLATIITILWARGDQFNNDGNLIKTGVLRIQTDPDNIQYFIYINEEKKDITDKRVNNLTAGDYTVRIQADGYTDWEKKVTIQTSIITDIFVKLYPKELALTQITKTNTSNIFFSSEGDYIYYVVDNSEFSTDTGIWRLPINPGNLFINLTGTNPIKIIDMQPEIASAVKSTQYSIIPSPDNSKILFIDRLAKSTYIINTNSSNKTPLTNLEKILEYIPDKISWYNNSSRLILTNKDLLIEYQIDNQISTVISYKPGSTPIYSNNNNLVVVFNPNTKLLQTYQNQHLIDLKLNKLVIPSDIEEITLPNSSSNIIYLKSASQGYYFLNTEKFFIKKIFDTNVSSNLMLMNNYGNSIILKDANGKYYSFVEFDNPGLNMIETKLHELNDIGFEDGYYKYTPQSTHIVYFDKADQLIKVVEKEGTNKIILLKEKINKTNANFNGSGDSLYLIMNNDQNSPYKSSIYRVKLDQAK